MTAHNRTSGVGAAAAWTIVVVALAVAGCRDPRADLSGGRLVLRDTFDGVALAGHWKVGRVEGPVSNGGGARNDADRRGHWHLREGALGSPGERNQALWLGVPLPDAVRVEFTARSDSDAGDIKFECFGDGALHESGYIFIMGGWNNSLSVIARRDEHEDGRQRRDASVQQGRTYRMAVTRRGSTVRWFVDGELYLRYRDAQPLRGAGHQHFAFNNWRSDLRFDDLAIYDLGSEQ